MLLPCLSFGQVTKIDIVKLLAQSGASSGHVIKNNGTAWTTGLVSSNEIQDGSITGFDLASPAVYTNNIADNSINNVKILDGTIIGEDISSMGATNGQVLKWNGAAWIPQNDNTFSGTVAGSGTTVQTTTASVNLYNTVSGYISKFGATNDGKTHIFNDAGMDLVIEPNRISAAKTSTGEVRRIVSFESPTIAVNSAAGSGATATMLTPYNDMSGVIRVTTGSSPTAGTIATVTFATGYANGVLVFLSPHGGGQSLTDIQKYSHTSVGTSSFPIEFYQTPAANTTYHFAYITQGGQ